MENTTGDKKVIATETATTRPFLARVLQLLENPNGRLSSKLLLGYLAFTGALVAGFFNMNEVMYSLLVFASSSLGVSGLERFAKK